MRKFLDKLRGAIKSVTVVLNAAFLAALPFYDKVLEWLPQIQPYVPDDIYRKVGIAVVVINLLLRFRTTTALENK